MATDGVDLVDEDDARRVRLALLEQIADAAGTDADEHLNEVRTRHRKERTAGFTGDCAGEQSLAGSRRSDQQCALGKTATELGEFLRILQEFDDLLELHLGFVRACDIIERHFGRVAGEKFRLGFTEAERLRPPRLHRTEQEEPDSEDEEIREEADQDCRERRPRIFGLNLNAVVAQARHFVARVLGREQDFELRHQATLNRDFLLEFSRQQASRLNRHLVDVIPLQLLVVLRRVGNLGRCVGSFARELDDRDGHQYDKNPERELFGNLAPVRRLLGRFVRHLYWHYCKLAMYGKWRKFSA